MKIGNLELSKNQIDKLFLVVGHIADKDMFPVVEALQDESSYHDEGMPPFEHVKFDITMEKSEVVTVDITFEEGKF